MGAYVVTAVLVFGVLLAVFTCTVSLMFNHIMR